MSFQLQSEQLAALRKAARGLVQETGEANEATRRARVIAYSGNPVTDDTVARDLFAAVLRKPATPAAILATVEHVVSL